MKKSIFASILSISLLSLSLVSASAQVLTDTLDTPNTPSCVQLTKGMTTGSKDSTTEGQVSDLQFFLSDKGYLRTDPTGYFGLATLAAVKAFQGDNGITQNGLVGPITRGKIASLTCSGDEPVSGNEPVSTTPSSIGNLSVNLTYRGGDTLVPGGSSAQNVNPLSPRTWSWTTTGAASVSANYRIYGANCVLSAGTTMTEENWQPWLGVNITGTRFSGSNTRALGSQYYGCTIEATYRARNTQNQTVSSSVKVTFAPSATAVGTPVTPPGAVACTMDARMCPDGSYVGRTGPSCNFAPCSSQTSPEVFPLYSCNGVISHVPCSTTSATSSQQNVCLPPTTTLILGDGAENGKTEEVLKLQRVLIRLGFGISSGPTGYFGTQTQTAVRAAQARYGLPVTGVLDMTSLNRIMQYCGVGTSSTGGSTSPVTTPTATLRISPSNTVTYPTNVTYTLSSTNAKSCSVVGSDGITYVDKALNYNNMVVTSLTGPGSITLTTQCWSGLNGTGVASAIDIDTITVTPSNAEVPTPTTGTPVATLTITPSNTVTYPTNVTYTLSSTNAKSCSVVGSDGITYVNKALNYNNMVVTSLTGPGSITLTTQCWSGLNGTGVASVLDTDTITVLPSNTTNPVCAYESFVAGPAPTCTKALEGNTQYGSRCTCTTGTTPTATLSVSSPSNNYTYQLGQAIPIKWEVRGAPARSQVVYSVKLITRSGTTGNISGGSGQGQELAVGNSSGQVEYKTGASYLDIPGTYEVSAVIRDCNADGCNFSNFTGNIRSQEVKRTITIVGVCPTNTTWDGSRCATSTSVPVGTYLGYLNGSQFILTQNITQAEALANCKKNQASNPTESIRCTWNGIEIFTYNAIGTSPSNCPTGTIIKTINNAPHCAPSVGTTCPPGTTLGYVSGVAVCNASSVPTTATGTPVATLTISPSNTVTFPTNVTYTLTSRNAKSCSVVGSDGITYVDKKLNYNNMVVSSITGPGTLTLTTQCWSGLNGEGTASAIEQDTITVIPSNTEVPPTTGTPVATLTISPSNTVTFPTNVTYTLTSRNAKSCSVVGSDGITYVDKKLNYNNMVVSSITGPGTLTLTTQCWSGLNGAGTPSAVDLDAVIVNCPMNTAWNGSVCASSVASAPTATLAISPSGVVTYPTNVTYTLSSNNAQSCSVVGSDGITYVNKSENVTNRVLTSLTTPGTINFTTQCWSGLNGAGTPSAVDLDAVIVNCPTNTAWNGTACTSITQTPPGSVSCTMDVKMCPDGSYVGRTPPSCAFAPCPSSEPVGFATLTQNLQIGSSVPEVKILQTILASLGYLGDENISGYFGLLTETAVKKFQCEKNIICTGTPSTTGYGMVGPSTRLVLNNSYGGGGATPRICPIVMLANPPAGCTYVNKTVPPNTCPTYELKCSTTATTSTTTKVSGMVTGIKEGIGWSNKASEGTYVQLEYSSSNVDSLSYQMFNGTGELTVSNLVQGTTYGQYFNLIKNVSNAVFNIPLQKLPVGTYRIVITGCPKAATMASQCKNTEPLLFEIIPKQATNYEQGNQPACTSGTLWNGVSCVSVCTGNQIWSGSKCISPPQACPSGTSLKGTSCVSICTSSQIWDGTLCKPALYTCLGNNLPGPTVTVTSSLSGLITGKGPFMNDSSLPAIARFLGANGSATLQVSDAGCISDFQGATANGVTTSPFRSLATTYKAMNVICTSGCNNGSVSVQTAPSAKLTFTRDDGVKSNTTSSTISEKCYVAVGASSCSTTIGWTTENATDVVLFFTDVPTENQLISATRGLTGTKYVPLIRQSASPSSDYKLAERIMQLQVTNSVSGQSQMYDITLRALCASGGQWNGSVCAPTFSKNATPITIEP